MEGGPVNGNTDGETRWAVQVMVEFDQSIFRHFRGDQWNEFVEELVRRGLLPIAWSKGERPPPIGVNFEFHGLRIAHCRLDGVDFTFCDLSSADLEGSSLKGARLGDCPKANLRRTRLQGASLSGDVSTADFTGATVDGTDFGHAYYFEGEPPIGLPPDAMAAIECVPKDASAKAPEQPFMQPLRARVTIHEVPW
jgi:hypothetical protein